jgi:hypothetical protein
MQHNCAQHHCRTKETQPIFQEREKTDQMASAVSHDMPQDFVLNTAQMRDALHMQKFRVRSDMFDQLRCRSDRTCQCCSRDTHTKDDPQCCPFSSNLSSSSSTSPGTTPTAGSFAREFTVCQCFFRLIVDSASYRS